MCEKKKRNVYYHLDDRINKEVRNIWKSIVHGTI